MPRGRRLCGCPLRKCLCGASESKNFEDTLLSLGPDHEAAALERQAPQPAVPAQQTIAVSTADEALVRREAEAHQAKRLRAEGLDLPHTLQLKLPVVPSLFPQLVVPPDYDTKDSNIQALCRALGSEIKTEVAWALNVLTKISYDAPDMNMRGRMVLAQREGIVAALTRLIAQWSITRGTAVVPSAADVHEEPTGFEGPSAGEGIRKLVGMGGPLSFLHTVGKELDASGVWRRESGEVELVAARAGRWWEDDELFNIDQGGVSEAGRGEKHQFAVCASTVLRNMTFLPDNRLYMVRYKECISQLIHCIRNFSEEDPEIVVNAVEALANLAPDLALAEWAEHTPGGPWATAQDLVGAAEGLLMSDAKVEHVAAADMVARLCHSQANVRWLTAAGPGLAPRLVELMAGDDREVLEAAVGAVHSIVAADPESRVSMARERWTVPRLLYIMQAQATLTEVSRKAALALEAMATVPENRGVVEKHEPMLAELAVADNWVSDVASRILLRVSGRHADPFV